jgi:membrane fusion protein, multidrug efflux system
MNRLRTLVGIGLGLAVVAGAGWYIVNRPTAPAARPGGRFAANAATPVGIATAVKGDIPIILKGLGTVTPLAVVTVKTQISGQLIRVNFEEGQMVKEGDLLAEVDPRPYEVALQQALGALQKDQALLKNAQIDLQRYKTLVAQQSIATQQYDTQAALVRQYEAALTTDQAAVDGAKLNLTYTRITAPVTGRVGLRQVDKGNYVQVGDANGLVVLTQIQPISVLFTIPEDSLPAVRKRMAGGATLDVTALDRSQKVELGTGKLTTTDNQIDLTTGTVKLRAIFDNTDQSLFPNQFVNVRLLVDTVKDAIVIPVAAIQTGQPGTFVYLVKPDDTVTIRVIKTGVTDGTRTAVTEGLQVGDQVVTDGVDRLRDGAKIRRPAAPTGAPIAAAPAAGPPTATTPTATTPTDSRATPGASDAAPKGTDPATQGGPRTNLREGGASGAPGTGQPAGSARQTQ